MPIPLGYTENINTPKADRNVEAYWTHVAKGSGDSLILPDGRCDIILRFNEHQSKPPTLIVTGPSTIPYTVSFSTGDTWLGMRLLPTRGALLWKKRILISENSVLRDQDAVELVPELSQLNRVRPSYSDFKRALEPLTPDKVDSTNQQMLDAAFDLIHLVGGRIGIDSLAAHVGCSARHLNRLFRQSNGLSAKAYSQLVRFHRGLRLIVHERHSITHASIEAGYTDQAHLTRSFRRFGGFTPSNLPSDLSIPTLF